MHAISDMVPYRGTRGGEEGRREGQIPEPRMKAAAVLPQIKFEKMHHIQFLPCTFVIF